MLTYLKPTVLVKNTVRFSSSVLKEPKPRFELSDIQRVLIISLTHLGDMITLTPFFRTLREELPKAEIHVLVKDQVKEVITRCPYVDKVLFYNAYWVTGIKSSDKLLPTLRIIRILSSACYDAVIITHQHVFNNLISYLAGIPVRIGFPECDHFLNVPVHRDLFPKPASEYPLDILRYIGFETNYHEKEFWNTDYEIDEARKIVQGLKENYDTTVFVFHPGAGGKQKILKNKIYATVIEHIIDRHKAKIILMAGLSEVDLADKIIGLVHESVQSQILNLAGQTTIGLMAAIMSESDIVVANDGGPMHIADAVNKPIISLFTASSPEIWGPINNPLSKVVYHPNRDDFPVEPILRAIDDVVAQL